MGRVHLTGSEISFKCKKRANVNVLPESYTRKDLFYINKKLRSDCIMRQAMVPRFKMTLFYRNH